MRRMRIALLAGALVVLAGVPAAVAGPPARFETNFTPVLFDDQNWFVVFVNIDRASACTAEVVAWENALAEWIGEGEVGDRPPEPEFPGGLGLISVQRLVTGNDAVVTLGRAEALDIELWHADQNVGFAGPCTDTDDEGSLFATGTTSWQFQANDLFGSGTRSDTFRADVRANVTDVDGNDIAYTFLIHGNAACHVGADGLPACLVERYVLAG